MAKDQPSKKPAARSSRATSAHITNPSAPGHPSAHATPPPTEDTAPILVDGSRVYNRTSYILVVDDDNTLLKFFKIHLNKFFSKVIVVKNAKEAIDTLREKEIDLVLSDIRMPRMDGFQLMKRVRKHDSSIPVFVISGALLSDEQAKMAEEDADGYLRKPFSVDELHAFIDNGMAMRQKFVRLAGFLSEKKQFRDLLAGKAKLEKLVAEESQDEARDLLNELKKPHLDKAS